jgi:dolichol-phosphate mannosyltransferase
VLQLLVFSLLIRCCRVAVAAPIAVEIAVLHNFLWHERFTWRDRKYHAICERTIRLCRFHAANGLISIVGNTLLTYALAECLAVPALGAAIAAIALCAPANFWVADRWVFASRTAHA